MWGWKEQGATPQLQTSRTRAVLLPPPPEAFHVDTDSGLVTTQRPLQSYERFNLTVVATDGGEPPLWGTTMLLVEVIDVNDNRPVFVRPPNGTILHIREVRLALGPALPSGPFPPPASGSCSRSPAQWKALPCQGRETEARQGQTCAVHTEQY